MTALTADRDTPFRAGQGFAYPCAASKTFYKGALVVLDTAGNAEPATAATGKIVAGISQEQKTSTIAAAETVEVKTGVALLANSSVNALTKANIGDVVYAEDDQTVGSLVTGMSAAGRMVDIEAAGVWVDVSPLTVSGLAAANNLSDVGSAATSRTNLGLGTMAVQAANNVAISGGAIAGITDLAVADGGTGASTAAGACTNLGAARTANDLSDLASAATARGNLGLGTIATQDANLVAISGGAVTGITDLAVADGGTGASTAAAARTNLGANKLALTLRATNLVAASAKVYSVVSPVAGTIAKIWSVLEGAALAVGDATLTFSIGGVAVTNGVVTITQVGSAEGDVDSATPSGANTVAAGSRIHCVVGGANTEANAFAEITVDITY